MASLLILGITFLICEPGFRASSQDWLLHRIKRSGLTNNIELAPDLGQVLRAEKRGCLGSVHHSDDPTIRVRMVQNLEILAFIWLGFASGVPVVQDQGNNRSQYIWSTLLSGTVVSLWK